MSTARILKLAAIAVLATLACADGDDPMAPGVEVGTDALPPAGTEYHGETSHLFAGGSAELFCGSHGTFTTAVPPPATQGRTVTSDYLATFEGELILEPPLVASAVTHPLSIEVHMVELITLADTQGTTRTFDTELAIFELGGSTAPAGVMIRESPSLASAGRTTITALSGDQYRIETYYDVWLELSLDGGKIWHPADNAVHMTLGPSTHR